jgi:hypothetical protein
VEPVVIMWGGLALALVGFMAAWTDRSFGLVQLLDQERFETIGRWLMRAGMAVAFVGAAGHILFG